MATTDSHICHRTLNSLNSLSHAVPNLYTLSPIPMFKDRSFSNVRPMMNPLDPDEFRRQAHMVVDFIADYYKSIEELPVLSQVEPGYLRDLLPGSAPDNPESIEAILQDVQEHILPGLTHWQSPNFFAYFPASGSTAGFLGEMLSTGFDVAGFNWMSSPAATELETIVLDWLGEMLELPNSFLFSGNGGGVIQGTTCEAILCTLVAARDQKLTEIGQQNKRKLVVYCSDQTHSAVQKAAHIAGIHPESFRAIKTSKSTSFSLSPDSLRQAILSDLEAGLIPLFLCATVGTTATTAVDPLRPLCHVASEFGIWVHVDAAYAGSACICPEFRHFIDGVELADSFSLNAHKWFFTTLTCCCLWVRDPSSLVTSLSTNPEFLRNKVSDLKQAVDYKNWQVALTRKFQAMKLWLVLRSYGVANLRRFLRSHVQMAKVFEELVTKDNRFEVVVPRNFAMLCFRASPSALPANKKACKINRDRAGSPDHDQNHLSEEELCGNELNRKLLESINRSGDLFMTHGVVEGVYFIRFAIGATLTEERHVVKAWSVVQEHLEAIVDV